MFPFRPIGYLLHIPYEVLQPLDLHGDQSFRIVFNLSEQKMKYKPKKYYVLQMSNYSSEDNNYLRPYESRIYYDSKETKNNS